MYRTLAEMCASRTEKLSARLSQKLSDEDIELISEVIYEGYYYAAHAMAQGEVLEQMLKEVLTDEERSEFFNCNVPDNFYVRLMDYIDEHREEIPTTVPLRAVELDSDL